MSNISLEEIKKIWPENAPNVNNVFNLKQQLRTVANSINTNITNGVSNALGNALGSTKIKSVLPIHYKIQKGGKRLKKTMKLFHNTLPKMKFSHLRKTSRASKKGATKRAHYSKLSSRKKKTRKRN